MKKQKSLMRWRYIYCNLASAKTVPLFVIAEIIRNSDFNVSTVLCFAILTPDGMLSFEEKIFTCQKILLHKIYPT